MDAWGQKWSVRVSGALELATNNGKIGCGGIIPSKAAGILILRIEVVEVMHSAHPRVVSVYEYPASP
jgi:hypothetical protein